MLVDTLGSFPGHRPQTFPLMALERHHHIQVVLLLHKYFYPQKHVLGQAPLELSKAVRCQYLGEPAS